MENSREDIERLVAVVEAELNVNVFGEKYRKELDDAMGYWLEEQG